MELWKTTKRLLDVGLEDGPDERLLLAASVFAFLSFESFLNELGSRVATEAWCDERAQFSRGKKKYRGTMGKFTYLAELCDYSHRRDSGAYQEVRQLAAVRETIAHGRTEEFSVEVPLGKEQRQNEHPQMWQWGAPEYANKAVASVEELSDGLWAAAKAKFGDTVGYRSSAFVGIVGERYISLKP